MPSYPSKRHRTRPQSQRIGGVCDGAAPVTDLPEDCWHHVFSYLSADEMARAATVNKTCNIASNDPRLWETQFVREWSPEHWVGHAQLEDCDDAVGALELSRAGPLVAWSVGYDNGLMCTDVTTCQTLKSVWDIHHQGSRCLTVVDSMGLVCTGGWYKGGIKGWDFRQAGDKAALSLQIDPETTGPSARIFAMISAGSLAGPQLITGGVDPGMPRLARRWDLRCTHGGPVREYRAPRGESHHYEDFQCLAIEPRQGTLFGGGTGNIERWDLETGERLSPLHARGVVALVAGEGCLLSGSYADNVWEWALPSPRAAVEVPEPPVSCWLDRGQVTAVIPSIMCMERGKIRVLCAPSTPAECKPAMLLQDAVETSRLSEGLGERPAGAVVGTFGGQLFLVKRGGKPVPIHYVSEDWPWPDQPVTCMAATEELLVIGTNDGALRMIRMGAS